MRGRGHGGSLQRDVPVGHTVGQGVTTVAQPYVVLPYIMCLFVATFDVVAFDVKLIKKIYCNSERDSEVSEPGYPQRKLCSYCTLAGKRRNGV